MKSRAISTVALVAALIACGHERSADPSALPTQDDALLAVTNDHWLDMNIFAVRGGTRQRLGTVPGFKKDTIPLRLTVLSGGTPVRLLAEPIGLQERHLSDAIQVGPGEVVDFRIRSPLNLSSVMVSRR